MMWIEQNTFPAYDNVSRSIKYPSAEKREEYKTKEIKEKMLSIFDPI